MASNTTSKVIHKLGRKVSGKGAVRVGKGFTLFISNKDINDIIKIIKSLEKSDVLIDDATEIVENMRQKTSRWIPWIYYDTYGCVSNSTCPFFVNKCYNWKSSQEGRKMTKRWAFF